MWSVVGCDALQPRHPSRMRPRLAPPSRFWADQEKSGAFGTGSWTDTSPLKACCRATPGLSADAVTFCLRKFVRLAWCGRRLDLVRRGFPTRFHRGSVRNVALKSLCKVGSVVGVDLRVVASTRHRHIRKPAIHKFLPRLLGVHVHEHAVRGLSLAAVARHRVAVVKMRILFYVECDPAA